MTKNSIKIANESKDSELKANKNLQTPFETKNAKTRSLHDKALSAFNMNIESYNTRSHEAFIKSHSKIAKIDEEIDRLYDSGAYDPILDELRKKKKRHNDKIIIRKVTEAEAKQDLSEIRGVENITYVSVSNGILKVHKNEFKRSDAVKVDMHGEKFKATFMSISPKSVVLRAKNGKKFSISIRSIKQDDVKLVKLDKK